MKIYNEVIIDMNTGETIYEDSCEHEGDIALCCGGGDDAPAEDTSSIEVGSTDWDSASRDWGLEALSMDQFYKDGQPKTSDEILNLILQHKPYNPDADKGMTEAQYKESVKAQIKNLMPQLTKPDAKKQAFEERAQAIKEGKAGLGMSKAEDAYGRAEDTYGLGVSALGRERGGIEETYQLGTRAAERGLDTALGQAQGQAAAMGAKARGAGGMGAGMRGAIGGQATLAKGVESTYGGYADKQTALAGARGRGLGAVSDSFTKLGLERDYAGKELGYAEDEYGFAMESAALAGERAQYGITKEAEADWESSMGSWLTGFKKGGRVPNKKTFLDILTKIPDAGGS